MTGFRRFSKKREGSNAILEEAIVMKTIFRFLSLAVLAAGFIAAGNTISDRLTARRCKTN